MFRRGFKRAEQFPLFSVAHSKSIYEIRLSDNSSFWDQGYLALTLTDTSFLRNPHYYLPSDTPQMLVYERMTRVTVGLVGAVCRIAGKEQAEGGRGTPWVEQLDGRSAMDRLHNI